MGYPTFIAYSKAITQMYSQQHFCFMTTNSDPKDDDSTEVCFLLLDHCIVISDALLTLLTHMTNP